MKCMIRRQREVSEAATTAINGIVFEEMMCLTMRVLMCCPPFESLPV
jgi:hypothetical protein